MNYSTEFLSDSLKRNDALVNSSEHHKEFLAELSEALFLPVIVDHDFRGL